MKFALATGIFLGSGGVVAALEASASDFRYSSDLLNEGFMPFATSGSGNAIYGMHKGTEMYLCFIMDRGQDQAERQRVLLAELAGEAPDPSVPNIPVACVLTQ